MPATGEKQKLVRYSSARIRI